MQRRQFTTGLMLVLPTALTWARDDGARWRAIEAAVGGRLGVAVLDTASGRTTGHRLEERFPMCSTFKWLVAAAVLQRVDAGRDDLQRQVRFDARALLSNSPVTEQHVGDGLTVAELCEAAVTVSDNAAANLLLRTVGGPTGLTAYARALGDPATRLDRYEPMLNDAHPGDPRDTTTPRAMSIALRSALLGDALSPAGRAQLLAWMKATTTGKDRLRAGVPATWQVADKTGTGNHGSTNDVALLMPPDRAPLVVAAYLTGTVAPMVRRNGALAEVGRAVAATPG